jgi:hypothetical protein
MTNEPTPETDAIAFPVGNRSIHPQTVVVAVNDARALEIQRNTARADAARLQNALQGMLIAEMEMRQMVGLSADETEAEPHWMAARAALDTPAQ